MVGPVRYFEDYEVGQEFQLGSHRFSVHDIVAFANEFDPQEFHIDPEHARQSSFGTLIASGLHTISVAMRLLADGWLNPAASMGSPGIDELRWLKPVYPDDVVTMKVWVTETRPSRSRPEMGSVSLGWAVQNQNGETVMTAKGVNLMRRRPTQAAPEARRAIKGIDHAVVVVRDLDEARDRYARLGFTVQLRGAHARLGTANHLMIFERNYLELIAVVEPNAFNASRREWLQRTGGGLANIALATAGADLAHEALRNAGLEPEAVLDFGRMVEIDGASVEAKFRTVRIPKIHAPILGFFVCDHLTPHYVYRAEWSQHPNGVRGLAGVTVVASQPASIADLLGKHFGTSAIHREADGLLVESGTQPIRYMTPSTFAQRHPGLALARADDHAALLSLEVSRPDQVAALLQSNGVAHQRTPDGRVLVAAENAGGVALEFTMR